MTTTPNQQSVAGGIITFHSEAPVSPANGDQWEASSDVYIRSGGVTRNISDLGGIGSGGGTVQGTDATYDIQAKNEGSYVGGARGEYSVDLQTDRAAATQVASGTYSSVLGGRRNTANSDYSFVGGGYNNIASNTHATIVNGNYNTASGYYNLVVSGDSNTASGVKYSTIVNGEGNTSSGFGSFVGVGSYCISSGQYSFVGTGVQNYATNEGSFIGGGQDNVNNGPYSFIGGGRTNEAIDISTAITVSFVDSDPDTITRAAGSFIADDFLSGMEITVSGTVSNNGTFTIETVAALTLTLISADSLTAEGPLSATFNTAGNASVVVGGRNNIASGQYSAIVGGSRNTCSGEYSFIGGGGSFIAAEGNHCYATYSVIGGGKNNDILVSRNFSVVCGGYSNEIKTSGTHSFIGGGSYNDVTASYAVVVGGTRAVADKFDQHAHSGGRFASDGDAQGSHFVLRKAVMHSDATWHELHLDGTDDQLTLASDTVWCFTAHITGATAGMAKSFGFKIEGVVENDGGTTTIKNSSVTTIDDVDDVSFDARAFPDDGTDALLIQVQDSDGGGDTVRWVCHLQTAELTFA